jgi:hypothetical protein
MRRRRWKERRGRQQRRCPGVAAEARMRGRGRGGGGEAEGDGRAGDGGRDPTQKWDGGRACGLERKADARGGRAG